MLDLKKCPICDTGDLEQTVAIEKINYRETDLQVPIAAYRCSACGEEIISPDLARSNDQAVRVAYKKAHQLLPGKMMKLIRSQLGLTQKAASSLFGGGVNSFAKYEAEAVVQSKAADILLRLVSENPALLGTVEQLANRLEVVECKNLKHGQTYWMVSAGSLKQPFLQYSSTENVNWPIEAVYKLDKCPQVACFNVHGSIRRLDRIEPIIGRTDATLHCIESRA